MSNLISLGKIIDQTWEQYTKNFKSLMKVTLWFFLISLIFTVIVIISPADANGILQQEIVSKGALASVIAQTVLALIIAPIIGIWIFLMTVQLAAIHATGKKSNHETISKASWKLFLPYVWVAILKTISILIPVLFIIPGLVIILANTTGAQTPIVSSIGVLLTFIGLITALISLIFVGVVFNFSEYALVFEGKGGFKALKHAHKLVKGRFWKTLLRIIIPKLVFIIPIVFIQFILALFFSIITPSLVGFGVEGILKTTQIADNLITTGIAVLSTPLFIIADYLIYDSLRKTKK